MTSLPRITIEESAVNDVIVLLDALLPGDAMAEAIDDPAALYTRYRAELRLFRRLLAPPDPRPAAAPSGRGEREAGFGAPARLTAGSILR